MKLLRNGRPPVHFSKSPIKFSIAETIFARFVTTFE